MKMWLWMISVFPYLWLDMVCGMASIQLIPQYPAINDSVTLNVTGISERFERFTWYKGPEPDPRYQVLRYTYKHGVLIFKGPQYTPRITAYSDGSLRIKGLQITDRGNYTVRIWILSSVLDINVTLTVYELVKKPVINSSQSSIQEGDFCVLTCLTANAEKITWSRQNESFPYGAIISADARTVTFTNINRSDTGRYQCEAENLVSKKISDVFILTVLYHSHDATGFSTGVIAGGFSPGVIAGIACGAVLGIVLILTVTYLLYKAYILPLREAKNGTKDQPEPYDKVLDLASKSNEPTYKDLQFKTENVYSTIS
ncbi:carcinoembryonic antigen-related cell adhesion molecule 1-like [Eleutherodactylus coqui]|uniref:carcinoembryonic antigen-related cell adhesion molecule 1-like n=1 Tax=Eleutherodactylus coqui TaxID=57060 RepID=UPI0034637763